MYIIRMIGSESLYRRHFIPCKPYGLTRDKEEAKNIKTEKEAKEIADELWIKQVWEYIEYKS